MNKVIVLSDSVRVGKSSQLMVWIKEHSDVLGFVTPRIHNKMVFYSIHDNNYLPYELDSTLVPSIKIGRYEICEATLSSARQLIRNFSLNPVGVFIIDEIGALEIKHHKGYEPAFSQLLEQAFQARSNQNMALIVVVRDVLLKAFLEKYGQYVTEVHTEFIQKKLNFEKFLK